MFELLSVGNPKLNKGLQFGYLSVVLHLLPSDVSGLGNTCPKASQGCKATCLNTAGRGGMFKKGESWNKVQEARLRRTKLFFENRQLFLEKLASDIAKLVSKAKKLNLKPAIRLNGTSDISWELIKFESGSNIFDLFPDVQFYDYTKVLGRKVNNKNYHLTFSKSEANDLDVFKAIKLGFNVAVVFDKLPETFLSLPVINGDVTDLRFLDPNQCIVGLKPKGKAKLDNSGFVVRISEPVEFKICA